jgi:hypothetical protein
MSPLWDVGSVGGDDARQPADDLLVPHVPADPRVISIAVRCEGNRVDGWTCAVALREHGIDVSAHRVRVDPDDLSRLAPGASDPAALVTASFEFLLEREPPQSILRSFDITEISRYFPAYESTIRARPRHVSSGPDV